MTSSVPAVRNGGQILIQQLRIQGVRRVFMVPGESFLPCIDALYDHQDAIDAVVCRQEGGAGYMAEAHGKLTNEPGICFVTRGPGATNVSIALHTAYQDSTPMILFVGQVGNDFMEREAFQEIDYRRMFGQMAKWVAQIDRTDRIPEFIARAFAVATSGRPGPVVLALPEDTLWGSAAVADLPRYVRPSSQPAAPDIERMRALIEGAERPFLLVGGSSWTDEALAQLRGFAERFDLPVGVSWRRLGCFDQNHPNFAGHVGWGMTNDLRERIKASDLLIAVGTRMDEPTTEGYELVRSPMPTQTLIHIHPDPEELGRIYHPTLAIVANTVGFAAAVDGLSPQAEPSWREHTRQANDQYVKGLEVLPFPGALNLNEAACYVRDHVPANTCITVGAGNYALYPHRYYRFNGRQTALSPILGAMGYGLPAAIAAKLENPDNTVVCYAGDGCFQMTMQELGTAMHYRLGVVVIVCNNRMWGTIRAHQEREFPARTIGVSLENPEFAKLVTAYGGHGEVVEDTASFGPAFDRALAFAARERLPALLELRYDPDGIAPDATLSGIREAALARQAAR